MPHSIEQLRIEALSEMNINIHRKGAEGAKFFYFDLKNFSSLSIVHHQNVSFSKE
jgi:hypothetical protein